jgi:hypothetical protein
MISPADNEAAMIKYRAAVAERSIVYASESTIKDTIAASRLRQSKEPSQRSFQSGSDAISRVAEALTNQSSARDDIAITCAVLVGELIGHMEELSVISRAVGVTTKTHLSSGMATKLKTGELLKVMLRAVQEARKTTPHITSFVANAMHSQATAMNAATSLSAALRPSGLTSAILEEAESAASTSRGKVFAMELATARVALDNAAANASLHEIQDEELEKLAI